LRLAAAKPTPYVPLLETPVITTQPVPTSSPPPPNIKKSGNKTQSSKKWITYKVKSGDSLWKISRRYGLHVKDIKRWNHLKSNTLRPGQKLRLYAKRK